MGKKDLGLSPECVLDPLDLTSTRDAHPEAPRRLLLAGGVAAAIAAVSPEKVSALSISFFGFGQGGASDLDAKVTKNAYYEKEANDPNAGKYGEEILVRLRKNVVDSVADLKTLENQLNKNDPQRIMNVTTQKMGSLKTSMLGLAASASAPREAKEKEREVRDSLDNLRIQSDLRKWDEAKAS